MIILLDGYNVLKSISSDVQVSPQERREFIKTISRYGRKKKHTFIIVFDGGPYEWIHQEKVDGIKVVYSGRFETADDYLINYMDEHKTKEILLVSSDNEIGRHASALELPSIGSDDFFKIVRDALNQQEIIAGDDVFVTLDDEEQDLDTLMQEGSKQVPLKKEDFEPSAIQRPASKMSRTQKKLYAILKKL